MTKMHVTIPAMLITFFILCGSEGYAQNACYKSIEDSVPTISIQGKGKVTAVPDEAIARFGVTSEEKLLSKAYKHNTENMNIVITTVKGMGIEEKDIKTLSYAVMPVYPKDDRGRQLPGKPVSYRVSQQLVIKIRDLSKVGEVIDKAITGGTNVFNGIQFVSSKINELEKEAKVKAAKDAKEKAELLAKNLGVTVGRVLKVSESSIRPYLQKNRAAFGAVMAESAPQIEPGSMEVNATCNVIYEIIQ